VNLLHGRLGQAIKTAEERMEIIRAWLLAALPLGLVVVTPKAKARIQQQQQQQWQDAKLDNKDFLFVGLASHKSAMREWQLFTKRNVLRVCKAFWAAGANTSVQQIIPLIPRQQQQSMVIPPKKKKTSQV
jgi:hypothetical protein